MTVSLMTNKENYDPVTNFNSDSETLESYALSAKFVQPIFGSDCNECHPVLGLIKNG